MFFHKINLFELVSLDEVSVQCQRLPLNLPARNITAGLVAAITGILVSSDLFAQTAPAYIEWQEVVTPIIVVPTMPGVMLALLGLILLAYGARQTWQQRSTTMRLLAIVAMSGGAVLTINATPQWMALANAANVLTEIILDESPKALAGGDNAIRNGQSTAIQITALQDGTGLIDQGQDIPRKCQVDQVLAPNEVCNAYVGSRNQVVNHAFRSGDPDYRAALAPGVNLRVVDTVLIIESESGTTVREDGLLDTYLVRLASEPAADTRIDITVTAASPSSEEEALGGDSVLVADDGSSFVRSVVLSFDDGHWDVGQLVSVEAPNDTLAEGERMVSVSHSVAAVIETPALTPPGVAAQTATVALFDGAQVRDVEVTVIDDDLPGLVVTEIDTIFGEPTDRQTVVLEGTSGLSDDYDLSLTRLPAGTVKIRLNLDDRLQVTSADGRFNNSNDTIMFTAANWSSAVRLTVAAIDDAVAQDPAVSSISHTVVATESGRDTGFDVVTKVLDVTVYDDETTGAIVIESGGDTVVTPDGTVTDGYVIRLTHAPITDVQVIVLTDGRADVDKINNLPVPFLQRVGDFRLFELFSGGIMFANDESGKATLTRGLGGDQGSFIEDDFFVGQLLQVSGAGPGYDNDYIVTDVSPTVLTLNFGIGNPAKTQESGVVLSQKVPEGIFVGEVTADAFSRRLDRDELLRSNDWLVDGFNIGQRVRVTNLNNPAFFSEFKIANIASGTIEFTIEGVWPGWLTGSLPVQVRHVAAIATFTSSNWDQLQTVALKGDPNF